MKRLSILALLMTSVAAQAAPFDWRHVTPLYLDAYREALDAS